MTEEQRKQYSEIFNSYIGDIAELFPSSPKCKCKNIETTISLAKEVFNKEITEEEAKEIFNNACELNNISSDSFYYHIHSVITGVCNLYHTIVVSKVFSSILNYFDNGIMLSYDDIQKRTK